MTTKIPVELSSTPGIVDGSNATAITIDSSENVGIGSGNLLVGTDSGAAFNGSALIRAQGTDAYINLKSATTNSAGILLGDTDDNFVGGMIYNNNTNKLSIYSGNGEKLTIDSSGNVGIGTTSPTSYSAFADNLVVAGAAETGITIASGNSSQSGLYFSDGTSGTEQYIGFLDYNHSSNALIIGTSGAEQVRITSGDGILGVGVSDPKAHIHTHIASSGGAYHQFTNAATNANSDDGWKIGIHDDENFIIWGQESSESFRVYNNGAYRFTIDHNGAVSVAGSFSKGSGSFKIDHPLPAKKDTHHLVHSFVEAPQADLIYRGTATLSSGTATVNLDTVAGMTEGTYVLLNTNSSCFTSNETDWDAVKGSVSGNTLTITCQNSSSTATVSWLVIGERHDQHMIDTEWTDDSGKVIVEPLKEGE